MDDRVRDIFIMEIELQCRIILLNANGVNAAMKAPDSTAVWAYLQGILISAANISKMLWGGHARRGEVMRQREAQRKPLRDHLGVTEDLALKDPDLRNDFEHFDQRLFEWYTTKRDGPPPNYMGRNISAAGGIVIHGLDESERFHHYDPETTLVSFWQHEVSAQTIVNEAMALLATIDQIRQGDYTRQQPR